VRNCRWPLTKKHIVDFALLDDVTRAYIQEIPQVVEGKWDRHPNPNAGNQDIGSPDRVGSDLYSDRCKFHLRVQQPQVNAFLLSPQVASLILLIIFLRIGLSDISSIFLPVGVQLVVRNSVLRIHPRIVLISDLAARGSTQSP
jgi:hypothetical protein